MALAAVVKYLHWWIADYEGSARIMNGQHWIQYCYHKNIAKHRACSRAWPGGGRGFALRPFRAVATMTYASFDIFALQNSRMCRVEVCAPVTIMHSVAAVRGCTTRMYRTMGPPCIAHGRKMRRWLSWQQRDKLIGLLCQQAIAKQLRTNCEDSDAPRYPRLQVQCAQ